MKGLFYANITLVYDLNIKFMHSCHFVPRMLQIGHYKATSSQGLFAFCITSYEIRSKCGFLIVGNENTCIFEKEIHNEQCTAVG